MLFVYLWDRKPRRDPTQQRHYHKWPDYYCLKIYKLNRTLCLYPAVTIFSGLNNAVSAQSNIRLSGWHITTFAQTIGVAVTILSFG